MREIKIYRKTATIQAEQFDGSAEMINRYSIEHAEAMFPTKSNGFEHAETFYLDTLEGALIVNIGDWIVIDNDEYEAIADDVFKASYVEVAK